MDTWAWRSPELGQRRSIGVRGGTLDLYDRGDGPPMVFSHGWLSNANLWRNVVAELSRSHRCVALDLPLGAHRTPMAAGADLTPSGIGALIAEAIAAVNLTDVTVVGCDSGGAYSQIALAEQAEILTSRVTRLVLTACETPFGQWPPPPFDGLARVARDAEDLRQLLDTLRDPAVRKLPAAFGLLHKHPLPPEVSDSYALPAISDRAILRDAAAVMSTVSSAAAHQAAASLTQRADLPVLLVWSTEDTVFPVEHARRFADRLAHARLVVVRDSYSFIPEDQPGQLAAAIAEFVASG